MATLLPEGKQSFTDGAGNPLVGGKLYTYDAGTSTPRPTYSDAAGTTPNTNPVVLDARGEATVFWSGTYKVVLKDAADAVIWSVDGISGVSLADLAAPGSSALVGYDGGTVQDVLDDAKPMANYTALRAYTGRATGVRITQAGLAGFFQRDTADTTSADNGGTVIVDGSGRRWKRLFTWPVNVLWFGAKGDGATDDTAAIQAAVNALPMTGGEVAFDVGVYAVSAAITINGKPNVVLRGPGLPGSWTTSTLGASIKATNSAQDVFKFSNYAYNCTVEGLHIFGSKRAIHFDTCLGFQVLRCNLRENQIGIEAFGNGVGIIRDNFIRSNSVAGIFLAAQSGDTVVTGNDIGANKDNIIVSTGSVKIHHNSIFSSKFSGAGCGVRVDATTSSSDAVIRGVEISGNLIANNDTQIKVIGTSLADSDVQDLHIHHNHIHQADDGGEGFDAAFAYGQGVLIQNAKRIHVSHNNLIGLRDFAIKAVNVLSGVFIDHNHVRAGNAAGVVFDLVQWGRIDNNEFVSNTGTAIQMTCSNAGDYTQNNRIGGNAFQGNGAVYTEDARTRANFVYDNLGGTLGSYSTSTTTPTTQVRHIAQAGSQESMKNQSFYLDGSAWNGSRLIMGSYNFWVDGAGKLRIKSSTPASDTDGTIVGTQT